MLSSGQEWTHRIMLYAVYEDLFLALAPTTYQRNIVVESERDALLREIFTEF